MLVIDRYELGERQTSACAMPTGWMRALELMDSLRQSFDEMVVHTPYRTARWSLPWSFSTFDYRELCALLWTQAASPALELETATVTGREGTTVHTDRGELSAPLVVDALGWRRVLSNATPIQPPNARLSRGLEVHPEGSGEEMELWIDAGLRARRLRLELSRARRAARRRRLVLALASRQGADRQARPRPRAAGAGLPGQLDPPPAARRGRGRRVLRRRLRRALPAADRRGHPHGAVLRARLRPRAARRGQRRTHARAGAVALRRVLQTRTSANTAGC